MTFPQYLLLFLLAPSALLIALNGVARARLLIGAIVVAAVLALIYTVPWLHAVIADSILEFDPTRAGGDVWGIPLASYLFIVLQAFFTGALAAMALRRAWWRK